MTATSCPLLHPWFLGNSTYTTRDRSATGADGHYTTILTQAQPKACLRGRRKKLIFRLKDFVRCQIYIDWLLHLSASLTFTICVETKVTEGKSQPKELHLQQWTGQLVLLLVCGSKQNKHVCWQFLLFITQCPRKVNMLDPNVTSHCRLLFYITQVPEVWVF